MRLKLITPARDHAEAWRTAVAVLLPDADTKVIVEPLHRVNVLVNGSAPDLVVAEATSAIEFAALEALAHAHPELEYVLVTHDASAELLMRAMRCGVREVLPAPADPRAVAEAVQRLARKRQPAAAQAPAQGRCLAVVSSKGGSGATFIAANLAHILSGREGMRVALIDLNLQFGDAALFVSSAQATTSIADVAHNIHRLDRELLQSSMTQVSPQFSVLPAPEDPARAADVLPEHVEAILAQARTMYDFVVIDAGRSLSAVTLKALDQCELVYAVLQLTLPYVRDARRLRDVFRSLDYPARKIRWIVNRHTKGSEITLDDVRKVLAIDDAEALPNQYDVAASSVNQGVPVDRLAPNSAIARALRALADGVAPEKARPRGGWLSGMFRGA
jgi:pilus assembly protein CpaE